MKAADIRKRFIEFFVKNGHTAIPSAPVVPENDPTVLFTTAGMHPLVPYLLGEPHPEGTRLTDSQKCIRTVDIDEVGDNTHLTFFEMLGNWSLGDYFKQEAITMSFTFLTSSLEDGGLGLPLEKLAFSCFEGDENAPRDTESAGIWKSLGVPESRIAFLGKEDNWWGPAGQTGPCGPDTEMFYWSGEGDAPETFHPENDLWVEIWNDVFMEYNKTESGNYEVMEKKNVDTGMGLERVAAILQGVKSPYETEMFVPIMNLIRERSKDETAAAGSSMRIIADHLRAATFIIADGIAPSNTDQGYVLRRIIRRAIRHAHKLGIEGNFCEEIARLYIGQYSHHYTELERNTDAIITELVREEEKFKHTLVHGEREFEKILPNLLKSDQKMLSGRLAFKLYDTYGYPLEMTQELASEHGLAVDVEGYETAYHKHQELSRSGAEQKFKGGLADHSEQTTALHTATHLLHQALRTVLGDHVEQRGSNITADRLRFDFSHPDKMTPEQIAEVEKIVNDQINRDLQVSFDEMTVEEAKNAGAIGLFGDRYGEKVKVYSIGDFSKEICGGPHVAHLKQLGHFSIKKEQASSAGVRRIKAVLENI